MELVLYWNENENFHLLGKCVFFQENINESAPNTHTKKKKTPCECVESKVDVWLNVLSCGYFQVRKSLLQRADAWKEERPDILLPWQGLEEEAVSLRTVVRILRIFENFEDSRENFENYVILHLCI